MGALRERVPQSRRHDRRPDRRTLRCGLGPYAQMKDARVPRGRVILTECVKYTLTSFPRRERLRHRSKKRKCCRST